MSSGIFGSMISSWGGEEEEREEREERGRRGRGEGGEREEGCGEEGGGRGEDTSNKG